MTAETTSPRRRRSPSVHAMDVHVGSRVRIRRTLLGMSQERLGDALGLTFQQVQKYERGDNRISAGVLWQLGRILDVPVSFFFDDAPAALGGTAGRDADNPLQRRESLEFMRAYYQLPEGQRRALFSLTKSMARREEAAHA
jgi:transcriptional regulator with XRE-family HTH domain